MKNGILALLTQGPAYGLQLRNELTARTGRPTPFNVGQVYATLDRLMGAGLVSTGLAAPDGTALYELTDAGRAAAHGWLERAEPAVRAEWESMLFQVLLARSLPGVQSDALIRSYRGHWDAVRNACVDAEPGTLFHARMLLSEAALHWLKSLESTSDDGVPISRVRPPRGRPPTR